MNRLKNKVCVVIGAGQTLGETVGNGRATAIRFAREGGQIILVDKNRQSAHATLDLIRTEGYSDLHPINADVTVESDCERITSEVIANFGRIDVLHYNVGQSEGDSEVVTLPQSNWDKIMSMNLRGFYLCSKHTLPIMRQQGWGVIQCISSAAAVTSGRNMTYKVSKAGMNALVQSMAIDNGKYGIRVNTIMPGLMDTPMAIERRARERAVERDVIRQERDNSVPLMKKMGTAWDVADAALFLASDEASYITGIALPVDGGVTARVG